LRKKFDAKKPIYFILTECSPLWYRVSEFHKETWWLHVSVVSRKGRGCIQKSVRVS